MRRDKPLLRVKLCLPAAQAGAQDDAGAAVIAAVIAYVGDETRAVPHALVLLVGGEVFYFKDAVTLFRDRRDALQIPVVQGEEGAAAEVSVDHFLALIAQKKQVDEELFVVADNFYCHDNLRKAWTKLP